MLSDCRPLTSTEPQRNSDGARDHETVQHVQFNEDSQYLDLSPSLSMSASSGSLAFPILRKLSYNHCSVECQECVFVYNAVSPKAVFSHWEGSS